MKTKSVHKVFFRAQFLILAATALSLLSCAPQSSYMSTAQASPQPTASTQSSNSDALLANAHGELKRFEPLATAYYPANNAMEGGFKDAAGHPLNTLQAYLRGEAPYASLAMDLNAVPYGSAVRIPELEAEFNGGKPILFAVVDTGGAFKGTHGKRVDVCVEHKSDAFDPRVSHRKLTLIVLDAPKVISRAQ